MLCNWASSKELCNEWSNMCEDMFKWKNIEITWDDNNIDYYIILNYPQDHEYYEPKKTIIFQMEPSIAIKHWGKWSHPDEKLFMFVGSHKNILNAVQLQIRTIPHIFPDVRENKLISILSFKAHDIGHIKRLNFIKQLEIKKLNLIDVYGKENYHNFNNYKGQVIENSKEKCFEKYKYCFQAENNSEYNYATEKIWEPIVCECLCFYWGCPNLEDYINSASFVRLNLDDIDGSIHIIKTAIEEDWWSQRIEMIREEKKKIINELGFFPTVKKIISNQKE
jgi:hypothetical protein